MRPGSRRLASVLAGILACGWAALVVLAPVLADGGRVGQRVSGLAFVAGGIVCHQRAARSFHLAGAQLPVCARCTALYVAGAIGLLAGLLLPVLRRAEPAASLARRWTWKAVLLWAAVPMLASVGLEWAGVWGASNAWRAASALPAAWAVGALVAESLSFGVRL